MHRIAAIVICLLLSGCIVLEPRAKNPFPNMNTIAVLPFFNQSATPGEFNDMGRTFGLAYMTELQQIEGYDVVPMGVVETALIEMNNQRYPLSGRNDPNAFRLDGPDDILRLAELLDVDAVVVGTVTYFDPWYPPQIGMKVNWYSPQQWTISTDTKPCVPCEEEGGFRAENCCDYDLPELRSKPGNSVIRGQNAVPLFARETPPHRGVIRADVPPRQPVVQLLHPMSLIPVDADPAQHGGIVRTTPQVVQLSNESISLEPTEPAAIQQAHVRQPETLPSLAIQPAEELSAARETVIKPMRLEPTPLEPMPMAPELMDQVETHHDPKKPVMSYTKMFDGKSPEIVQLLRDYVEIRGDKRSGGWEGYMQRTDDYIHFCCHTMIVDMLSLHGGALRTKVWLKPRKAP